MNRTRPHLRSRRSASTAALLLVLALAAALAAPAAQATFPGRPGPIAFSHSYLGGGESETQDGLFAHGPRVRDRARRLTTAGVQSAPSYSADGRSLAFAAAGGELEPNTSHIYVIGADGTGVRQLTSGHNYDSNPSFSPDGGEIVFDRQAGTSRTPHLYIVEVGSGEVRRVTSGSAAEYEPSFTADGRRIVFAGTANSDGGKNRSAILWVGVDGHNLRILIDTPRNDSEPDVSPNGRRILFVSSKSGGNSIYVAGIKSGRARPVTKPVPTCIHRSCFGSPVFSPDEKHIAALYSGTYSSSLVVMRADGTGAKTFASGSTEEEGYGSHIGPPAWGPVR
jgi:Tol biopolymer transport system component